MPMQSESITSFNMNEPRLDLILGLTEVDRCAEPAVPNLLISDEYREAEIARIATIAAIIGIIIIRYFCRFFFEASK
jgi:hypothetical protein